MVRLVSKGAVLSLFFTLGYVVASTAAFSFAGNEGDKDYLSPPPEMANGNCTAQQTAYNTAVVNYQAAEQTVEDTYNAWVACEGGGEERPTDFVNPITADDSILVE